MTTSIEWTRGDDGSLGETWNPTTGCDRTSSGCDNCYALTMAKRLKGMGSAGYQNDGDPRTSGPGFGLTLHPDRLDLPLRWKKPRRIFVNSMSDLFHPDVPDEFIGAVVNIVRLAPQHIFQVLTKRPQRMADVMSRIWWDCNTDLHVMRFAEHGAKVGSDEYGNTWPLPNLHLGTSIESDRYTFRADHLRGSPAAVRFLSLEPLLGPLPSLDLTGIDWVITGAESGPGARPMDVDWVRDIRDRCVEAKVAFFYKQGADARGRKIPTPELDGRRWTDYPA